MKRYLVIQEINAEAVTKEEAEKRLNKTIRGSETDGFLVCDSQTLKWEWIPLSKFKVHTVPFDSPIEKISLAHKAVVRFQDEIKDCNKGKINSIDEKQQVYLVNRFLKSLEPTLKKIINLHTLKSIAI